MLSTHWRFPHQPTEQDLRRLDLYARQASDFIERSLADQALRRSEEMSRVTAVQVTRQREELYAILMQSPLPTMVFRGPELICELANQHAMDLLPQQKWLGRGLSDMTWIGDNGLEEHLRSVLESGEPVLLLERPFQRCRAGEVRETFWNYSLSPLRDSNGAIDRVMAVAVEVTDEVMARREMEEAVALKDHFLSLMSHELRTPLSTIYGASILLDRRFGDLAENDRRELVSDIVGETSRLHRIIENLLLMTRLDARGLELEPVETRRVLQSSVETFQDRNTSHPLQVELSPNLPLTTGNQTYIELVLDNLLSNAAKYSDPGQPIQLTANFEGVVEIRIMDRGIGLTEEEARNLFTPFYRAPAAIRKASGVGVGLAVCKRVVEAQGGSIWAKPREGGGSEFGFTLRPLES